MIRRWALAATLLLLPALATSHVTVSPRESKANAYEKYVVRVPTEGKVATQSVELRVPDGVTLVSMGAPAGFTYELKRTGDKVTAIVWSMTIKPGEFAEFAFMARNPSAAGSLKWQAVQRFVDGTSTQWIGEAGTRHPASVTKIAPGASDHAH